MSSTCPSTLGIVSWSLGPPSEFAPVAMNHGFGWVAIGDGSVGAAQNETAPPSPRIIPSTGCVEGVLHRLSRTAWTPVNPTKPSGMQEEADAPGKCKR